MSNCSPPVTQVCIGQYLCFASGRSLSPGKCSPHLYPFLLWEEAEYPKGESSELEAFLTSTNTWLFLWLASLEASWFGRGQMAVVKPHPQLCSSLAVSPWVAHSTSLSLSVPLCQATSGSHLHRGSVGKAPLQSCPILLLSPPLQPCLWSLVHNLGEALLVAAE